MNASFGTVNIRRPAPSTVGAWWFTAPRDNFTRICEQQYADHMKGSYGDRIVSGAVVIGYLEAPKKKKGAK